MLYSLIGSSEVCEEKVIVLFSSDFFSVFELCKFLLAGASFWLVKLLELSDVIFEVFETDSSTKFSLLARVMFEIPRMFWLAAIELHVHWFLQCHFQW